MPPNDDLHLSWSPWRPFPDPRTRGVLQAPFGPGVYELRLAPPNGALVLVGIGANLAARMSSLLPVPLGCGTRSAADKRAYVLDHLNDMEYRTLACTTRDEAALLEGRLLGGGGYRFNR
ncbi:MAG: hypothetical protein ACRYG8_10225 [Janthinobacterium lividum]